VSVLRLFFAAVWACSAAEVVSHPFAGVTLISRTQTAPRNLTMHVVSIDLTAPGISFKLTAPSGTMETVRQTTVDFLKQEHAQVAINAHYFLPFPSESTEADLVGFAASGGTVFSGFETPAQRYAIVDHAPAINIDRTNHAAVVHWDSRFADGKHVRENVQVWNAASGSAQIVTEGARSIPSYAGAMPLLLPGGPRNYSETNSWYDALQARTAIGLSREGTTLYLFTADRTAESLGMKVGEVADLLIRDYRVYEALNLDGGGSTSLAMEDPASHAPTMLTRSTRAVGSSLAVFAPPTRAAVR